MEAHRERMVRVQEGLEDHPSAASNHAHLTELDQRFREVRGGVGGLPGLCA
jgi:hypothetical protein